MKTSSAFGLKGISVALAMVLAGCRTEKIMVDYLMPAKAVTDISKVNIVDIKVEANVTGNLAGDNKKNAWLVKRLLAMRLYKEGFYQVADEIWSTPVGASSLERTFEKKVSGHGYATLSASGQGTEKAVIDVSMDLTLDARPVSKEIPFTLATIPYKLNPVKKGEVPTSTPEASKMVVQKVKKDVTVYEIVAKGTLTAKFSGVDGKDIPQKYENTFQIVMPESDKYDSAKPSQMKVLATAVSPVVDGIVSDISPYTVSRELVAVEGGDERVVLLLNAKAFMEVVAIVEKLEESGKANFADIENKGIAFEAMGDFFSARDAYKRAATINPKSASANDGVLRIEDILSGKKSVKESGGKQNRDIKFSK